MSMRLTATLSALALAAALNACSDATGPEATAGTETIAQFAKGSGSQDGRMEIRLAGSPAFPRADGKAKFRDRGGEQELQIEVEDGPAGAAVTFFVNGSAVATATTNVFGDAEINLNSDLGQAVPAVGPGTSVAVRTAGGTLIASGSF